MFIPLNFCAKNIAIQCNGNTFQKGSGFFAQKMHKEKAFKNDFLKAFVGVAIALKHPIEHK